MNIKKVLQIHSIFESINGEVCGSLQGSPTTFVRLQGCNLRCGYCDTVEAQESSDRIMLMTPAELAERIWRSPWRNVTFTGGEPLIQWKNLDKVIDYLGGDFKITIETNGTKSPNRLLYPYVYFVMDWKLPSSNMEQNMKIAHFQNLRKQDFVKFIIQDMRDYIEAKLVLKKLKKLWLKTGQYPQIAFSPCMGVPNAIPPARLVEMMLEDKLKAIFNLQIHKVIGVA